MTDFHKIPVDLFNNIFDYIGTGNPSSPLVNAVTGSLFRQLDGVSGSTLWQKTLTGWEKLQGSFGSIEIQGRAVNDAWVGENIYYDGSDYRYRADGSASQIYFGSAPSVEIHFGSGGAAGTVATTTSPYVFKIGTAIFNNQGTLTLNTAVTYSLILERSGSAQLTFGSDASNTYIQTWDGKPLWLNHEGGALVIGTYLQVGANSGGGGGTTGDIVSRNTSTTGIYYFGDSSTVYLNYDGSNYNFGGSGSVRASGFVTISDRNVKDNLIPIESALDKVERLTGYLFNYKTDPARRRAGVVAQEVQAVLPEAVILTETLGVSYDSLVPLLIEAIKELRGEFRTCVCYALTRT